MRMSDGSSDVCSSVLYFLAQLAHQTSFPVPKHAVEEFGRDWTKPENIVVNGAYKLVSWTPTVEATLVKNDKFYDADNVAIDKVIYYAMEERTAMQQRFRAGELYFARHIASEQIAWLPQNMADSLRLAPSRGPHQSRLR